MVALKAQGRSLRTTTAEMQAKRLPDQPCRRAASALSNLVGNTAKAIETFELSERLGRLEEQMAAKGSNPGTGYNSVSRI